MRHNNRWILAILVMAGLLLSACASKPPVTEKIQPAKVEPIEGTDLKRVTLTEKAAERVAIQTAPVQETQVVRQREIGGQVVALPAAEAGTVLVRVALSEADLARVDRSQPAVVLPLDDDGEDDDDEEAEGLEAEEVDDVEDDDDEGTALYFSVSSSGQQALAPGQLVRVKLAMLASGTTPRKLVPYAAVIYDVNGGTWVYTKEPNALSFVRQSITVDYIEGDLAFLIEGPPVGTEVVTVGGAELYGAETGVSK